MNLANKNILLISPEPWDHIFVSKHHYAVALAKRGNTVFFLNPPGNSYSVSPTEMPGVLTVHYAGFPRGLRFYPRFLQCRAIARVYRKLSELCRTEFHVVWSFDNSVFFDFSAFPENVIKISHIVDFNQDFQTRLATSTADVCLCVSEAIRSKLLQYRREVHKIGHGFYVPNVSGRAVVRHSNERARAVYAGNLSIAYIDWLLLSKVIEANGTVDFVFVGPFRTQINGDVIERLGSKPNVFFVGRVAVDELYAYYESADVLLIAYQEQYQEDQVTNTHKMLEYLGSGRVVVATRTLEYNGFFPLVVMSERNSEWPALFADVIDRLSFFNSENLKARRIAYAMNNTYGEQISRIEGLLTNNLLLKNTL